MNSTLEKFVKEHELSVLSEKEQELLDEYGGGKNGTVVNALGDCSGTTNNCNSGNCAAGCGVPPTTKPDLGTNPGPLKPAT